MANISILVSRQGLRKMPGDVPFYDRIFRYTCLCFSNNKINYYLCCNATKTACARYYKPEPCPWSDDPDMSCDIICLYIIVDSSFLKVNFLWTVLSGQLVWQKCTPEIVLRMHSHHYVIPITEAHPENTKRGGAKSEPLPISVKCRTTHGASQARTICDS